METAIAVSTYLDGRGDIDPGAVIISSFKTDALGALTAEGSGWRRGLLVSKLPADWLADITKLGCYSLHLKDQAIADATVVEEVRAEGVPLLVFTVNDPNRSSQLLDWGVDSVITDDPKLLAQAM